MDPSKRIVERGGQVQGFGAGLVQFHFQAVQFHLLQEIFGLERQHAGFVFHRRDGGHQVGARVVAEDSLSVPGPFEDLGSFETSM